MACFASTGIRPRISGSSRSLAPVRSKRTDALGQRLGLGDLDVIGAVVRPALVAQKLPGKDHVVGGHRLAVGEFRGGIEREGDVGAVGVGLDRAGEQAVERERLVIAARQQALDHVAADLRQREAFDDERVEAVEGAEHALRQAAALGRGRIGVAQHGRSRAAAPARRAWRCRVPARRAAPKRACGERAARRRARPATAPRRSARVTAVLHPDGIAGSSSV